MNTEKGHMGHEKITLNRGIEIVKNIVAELVNYLLVFSIAYVLILDFFKQQPEMQMLVLLALVPLFYYLVREIFKNFFLFFLIHLLPVAGILVLYEGHIVQKGVFFAMTVILMVASVSKRFTADSWGMEVAVPPAVVGVYFVLYALDGSQGGQCSLMLFQNMILFVIGYFVFYFLKQFLRYVDVNNRTTDHIPVNHIFFSAMVLAFGFTAVGGALIFVTANRDLMEKIGAKIQGWIVSFFVFLFSLFPEGKPAEPIQQETGMITDVSLMDLIGKGEATIVTKILDVLLSILAIGVAFFLLFLMVAGVIRLIQMVFGRQQRKHIAVDDGHRDVVESLDRKPGTKSRDEGLSGWQRLREAFTPAEKIRRLYRRTLNGAVHSWDNEEKSRLIQKATARECLCGLFTDRQEEALKFASLYEKARYGNVCTAEDFKTAKALADQLK